MSSSLYIDEKFHHDFPLDILGGYFICSEKIPNKLMCDRIIELILSTLCERFKMDRDRLRSKAGNASVRQIKELAAFLMILFRIPNELIADVCDRCATWVLKSYKQVGKMLVNQANVRKLLCEKYEKIRREIEFS